VGREGEGVEREREGVEGVGVGRERGRSGERGGKRRCALLSLCYTY
jgi:hypothetical protein